jgi:hypothetical protein
MRFPLRIDREEPFLQKAGVPKDGRQFNEQVGALD